MLVEEAPKKLHVLDKTRELIMDFYNNFKLRIGAGISMSNWHTSESVIRAGCTF